MSFVSNIAWFKISESIIRNEREKALITYRLLSHSILSESFKFQLLGDLYQSLEEKELALDCYNKSLLLSENSNDYYGAYVIKNKLFDYDSKKTRTVTVPDISLRKNEFYRGAIISEYEDVDSKILKQQY